jgi:hypothetical protein
MPYRDPEGKREWEVSHRAERLARRRELRRIQAAQPIQPKVDTDGAGVLLIPLLAGGALAAYRPQLALGAGGLTLLAAMHYRKGWQWWLVGALTVLLALVFLKWDKEPKMGQGND